MADPRTRWIAGCMTGTSLDGLDAALVEVRGTGLEMTARYRGMVSKPLGDLADELRHFAEGRPAEPIRYLRAARRLGALHADAVAELVERFLRPLVPGEGGSASTEPGEGAPGRTVAPAAPADQTTRSPGRTSAGLDLVVAHGQTIWHAPAPASGGAAPHVRAGLQPAAPLGQTSPAGLSWQLLDPWPIVRHLGVPVCYDLRQADLIAGGQGAPITPLADWVMYRDRSAHRRVVNLGGVCNVTDLPPGATPDQVAGEDLGPCNLLIDGVTRRLFPGTRFDRDGLLAAQGRPLDTMYHRLLEAPFFTRPRPRTTGREDFSANWLADLIQRVGAGPHDLLASAVDAVARLVVESSPRGVELVLAGGGARNPVLVAAMGARASESMNVVLCDDLGLPCEAREAMAFAVLGALSQDGVPITLPRVTGAQSPGRAGAWALP